MKGIYITPTDVQFLHGYNTYESGRRLHQQIRDSFEKGKKALTLDEYCYYFDVDPEAIKKQLNAK